MKKLTCMAFVLMMMLAACSPAPHPTESLISSTQAEGGIPGQFSVPYPVYSQLGPLVTGPSPTLPGIPTRTLEPSSTTGASTPSPELLTCPSAELPQPDLIQPVEILYVNDGKLWIWNEVSREKTQVRMPPDTVAPHVSADGRFAAYLIEGQAYDSSEEPLDEIPLWLIDLQSEQTRQVASFPISETRRQDPESPHIYLRLRWLESESGMTEDHWLLVEVYREPWAETGCCAPRDDLYLVQVETGEYLRILRATSYNFYSTHPDGKQIAALNMDGKLYLIDLPPSDESKLLSVHLPTNPWLVFAPVYSPDGAYMAFQVENGLAVVDANNRSIQQLDLENPCEDCYWGPRLPVTWQPDGRGFFTTTSLDDRFDQRAETTLIQVHLEPELKTETLAIINANPFTFQFSPSFRYLSYWNQPDLDDIDAGEGEMNWVSLHLMDLQDLQSILYAEEFGLRVSSWSPDGQRFLFTFSPVGGPNLDRRMLSLGNVCRPSQELPVPTGSIIDEIKWLDSNQFLAWTLPSDGIPDRYTSGLYLYRLDAEDLPIHIDDISIDQSEPYGSLRQVVVLSH